MANAIANGTRKLGYHSTEITFFVGIMTEDKIKKPRKQRIWLRKSFTCKKHKFSIYCILKVKVCSICCNGLVAKAQIGAAVHNTGSLTLQKRDVQKIMRSNKLSKSNYMNPQ